MIQTYKDFSLVVAIGTKKLGEIGNSFDHKLMGAAFICQNCTGVTEERLEYE